MDKMIPKTMSGVVLTGHGGLDMLQYREDIPVPNLGAQEVLIKVGGCAVNNTDINTRIGWYSKKVTVGTDTGGREGFEKLDNKDASWSGQALEFPRIQGSDVAGTIVAVGVGADPQRIGERVIVRNLQDRPATEEGLSCVSHQGGFAQYTKTVSEEAYAVKSPLTDIELASFPCAYSTAENMLARSEVREGDRVLITGASGGVGSAAIQLAKLREATVVAVCSGEKKQHVTSLGADEVIVRGDRICDTQKDMSVDVVLDLTAGPQWPELLQVLKRGGRYATAGAISGPLVELDLRTLYLKDLSFFGCTYQPGRVFRNLIGYIESGKLKPIVSKSYPLRDIRKAQDDFLSKKFVGKLVLFPEG